MVLVATLGYSQHAKSYCSGQWHSLPPASATLAGYPCDGGGGERALYLLRNMAGAWSDLLRLAPPDRWAAVQVALMALRLAAALALPRRAYSRLVVPLASQVHRLVPLVYLAALALTAARAQAGAAGGGGSGGNSSSTPLLLTGAGQWYLCSFPLLDLLTNLLNPVYLEVECAYAALAAAALVTWWASSAPASAAAAAAAAATDSSSSSSTGGFSYSLGWLLLRLVGVAGCLAATAALEVYRGHPARRQAAEAEAAEAAHVAEANMPEAERRGLRAGGSAGGPAAGGDEGVKDGAMPGSVAARWGLSLRRRRPHGLPAQREVECAGERSAAAAGAGAGLGAGAGAGLRAEGAAVATGPNPLGGSGVPAAGGMSEIEADVSGPAQRPRSPHQAMPAPSGAAPVSSGTASPYGGSPDPPPKQRHFALPFR